MVGRKVRSIVVTTPWPEEGGPLAHDRSLAEELALALRLADQAAAIALEHFNRGVTAERKPDGTPVTAADLAVERMLLNELARERPDDSVLGEETGIHGASPWRWILDPIDGTYNFVGGRPQWGTHVALEHEGAVVVGVITRPARGQRWWATRQGGTFCTDPSSPDGHRRLRVSTTASLREARVSLWVRPPSEARARLGQFAILVEPDLDDLLRLLDGQLEAVVDPIGSPWDHAPAVVLVEEAGGRFEDRDGGHRIDLGEGRYTNGFVEAELRQLLR